VTIYGLPEPLTTAIVKAVPDFGLRQRIMQKLTAFLSDEIKPERLLVFVEQNDSDAPAVLVLVNSEHWTVFAGQPDGDIRLSHAYSVYTNPRFEFPLLRAYMGQTYLVEAIYSCHEHFVHEVIK
jgi:hypothetical protein